MENACIYPFHEELDVIFEINNHSFRDPIYDSYSEASNEEPKYLEPIEQPSIKGDMPIFNIDFGHHFEHIFIDLFQPYHLVFKEVLGHNFIVISSFLKQIFASTWNKFLSPEHRYFSAT